MKLTAKQEEEVRKAWNRSYPKITGNRYFFHSKLQWAHHLKLPDNCPLADHLRYFRLAYAVAKGWV